MRRSKLRNSKDGDSNKSDNDDNDKGKMERTTISRSEGKNNDGGIPQRKRLTRVIISEGDDDEEETFWEKYGVNIFIGVGGIVVALLFILLSIYFYKDPIGCSDGTREGFESASAFPYIAACSGGFSIPGIINKTQPECDRYAGNNSSNPTGEGCNVQDLCAIGWRMCRSAVDVRKHMRPGAKCQKSHFKNVEGFWVTGQSGGGDGKCGKEGYNDIFGCGNIGQPFTSKQEESCLPLNVYSDNLCTELKIGNWKCGENSEEEALHITKGSRDGGGVLCCKE